MSRASVPARGVARERGRSHYIIPMLPDSISHLVPISRTGKIPVPQKMNFIVGWAGEPAFERLIDHDARCLFHWTSYGDRYESIDFRF